MTTEVEIIPLGIKETGKPSRVEIPGKLDPKDMDAPIRWLYANGYVPAKEWPATWEFAYTGALYMLMLEGHGQSWHLDPRTREELDAMEWREV